MSKNLKLDFTTVLMAGLTFTLHGSFSTDIHTQSSVVLKEIGESEEQIIFILLNFILNN